MPRRAPAAPPGPGEAVAAPDQAPAPLGYEKWVGFLSNIVAPATLLTGLMFYFGYVSSRSFFLYFGIDVDVIGLSNQQFVMRSPGALFLPVTVILLLAAALIVGHRLLRRRLAAATPQRRRRVVTGIAAVGVALLVAGIVLALAYGALSEWTVYAIATALALGSGGGLAAYAAQTARHFGPGGRGRSLVVLLVAVMVAGAFWATATVAEWWGRGEARALAGDLSSLPAVVLDAKERLAPGNPAILATALEHDTDPEGTPIGDPYRFRYQGLRLLVRGGDYLFLVPDVWSADASTLVVPLDPDAFRVRFRFFPDVSPP